MHGSSVLHVLLLYNASTSSWSTDRMLWMLCAEDGPMGPSNECCKPGTCWEEDPKHDPGKS
jgi:hypothetical protein